MAQGVPLNIDTTIFKIRKFHYYVRYNILEKTPLFILQAFSFLKINWYWTCSCKYLDFPGITFVVFEQNVKNYPTT